MKVPFCGYFYPLQTPISYPKYRDLAHGLINKFVFALHFKNVQITYHAYLFCPFIFDVFQHTVHQGLMSFDSHAPHRLQYPNSSALLSFSMIYPRHQHHDCIIASSSSDCPRYNSLQSLILLIISTVRPVVKATTAFILVSHVSLAGIIIIVTIAQNYHHH